VGPYSEEVAVFLMGRELKIRYRNRIPIPIPVSEFQTAYIQIPLSENNSIKKRRKR